MSSWFFQFFLFFVFCGSCVAPKNKNWFSCMGIWMGDTASLFHQGRPWAVRAWGPKTPQQSMWITKRKSKSKTKTKTKTINHKPIYSTTSKHSQIRDVCCGIFPFPALGSLGSDMALYRSRNRSAIVLLRTAKSLERNRKLMSGKSGGNCNDWWGMGSLGYSEYSESFLGLLQVLFCYFFTFRLFFLVQLS